MRLEDKTVRILKGPWVSADGTLTVPQEVHLYADGTAIACHADSDDVRYDSIAALEAAYQIEVVS